MLPETDIVQSLYALFLKSNGVSTDTRKIKEGQLFFALKGANFDGNTMAAEALNKGALRAIVDDEAYMSGHNTILVSDALKAMQQLARHHRAQQKLPVLGITGSNGKTTTKEIVLRVLQQSFNAYATPGNYNNHIGVPLTILNAPADADFWIIEMGTNQPGDIAELCSIAMPNYGLITNIGLAHLEKLLSQEGIYREKSALYHSVLLSEGTLFINNDDPYLNRYFSEYQPDYYELYNENNCGYGQLISAGDKDSSLMLTLKTDQGLTYELKTQLMGDYNQINISAALTIGAYFKIAINKAIDAIAQYYPQNMRSQAVQTDKNKVILDTYNANPSSMSASLKVFIKQTGNDQVIIIGDMLELGEQAEYYHREVLNVVTDSGLPYFLVGDIFRKVCRNEAKSFKTTDELQAFLKVNPLYSKTIFLKGSRGMKLEKLLDVL